ncbi:hypothetical protein [Brevibacillus reuszeri]|uniref:hypothetical protein n=1 Tax=Brevibacillus reuszeri TaxID=54915 RepID=UPI003D212BAA
MRLYPNFVNVGNFVLIKFQKFLMVTLVLFLSVMAPAASARESANFPELINCENLEDFGDVSLQTQSDGTVDKVIEINNPNEFIKRFRPNATEIPSEITFFIPDDESDDSVILPSSDIQALAASDTYINVKSIGKACGSVPFRESSYSPPGGKMIISEKRDASYSVSVNVSVEIISAGVGFSVTEGFQVSDEQLIEVPKGKLGVLRAYEKYQLITFDVMQKGLFGDKKIGQGTALKPVGVCFGQEIF